MNPLLWRPRTHFTWIEWAAHASWFYCWGRGQPALGGVILAALVILSGVARDQAGDWS